MYTQLQRLPLIQLDDEYTQTEREALEFLKSERLPKSTGGLVEGKEEVPQTKENPADRVDPATGLPYSDNVPRVGLQEGGIPEGAVRIYDEDQGLKNVAPLAEIVMGLGAFKFGKGLKEVGEEIIEKRAMPKVVTHGSTTKNLKEIETASFRAIKETGKTNEGLQSGIYTSRPGGMSSSYGKNGEVYPIDTSKLSNIKNIVNIGRDKILNTARVPKSLYKKLDKEINVSINKRGNHSLKNFKEDLINDNGITVVTPKVQEFLVKNNYKAINTRLFKDTQVKNNHYILLEDMVKVKGK